VRSEASQRCRYHIEVVIKKSSCRAPGEGRKTPRLGYPETSVHLCNDSRRFDGWMISPDRPRKKYLEVQKFQSSVYILFHATKILISALFNLHFTCINFHFQRS
jgi:hypothetical protein